MASRTSSKAPRRDPSIRTSKGRLIRFFPLPERVELSIEHLLATPKPRSFSTLSRRQGSLAIRRSQAENVQLPGFCLGAYLVTHRGFSQHQVRAFCAHYKSSLTASFIGSEVLDQHGENGRVQMPARIVKVVAGERFAPIIQHPAQAANRVQKSERHRRHRSRPGT
jgi:hypothetical protein